jgi:hypothetical protein
MRADTSMVHVSGGIANTLAERSGCILTLVDEQIVELYSYVLHDKLIYQLSLECNLSSRISMVWIVRILIPRR